MLAKPRGGPPKDLYCVGLVVKLYSLLNSLLPLQ